MHQAEEQVADRQYDGSVQPTGQVIECFGNAQRQHEHGCHAGKDGELDGPFLSTCHVGQPGIPGPRPPEQHDHQDTAEDSLPTQLVSHEGRHLSKCEHENQVKEQLKRGDPRLILFLADEWMSSLPGNIVQATASTQVAGGS
jgi:hypothetical protein